MIRKTAIITGGFGDIGKATALKAKNTLKKQPKTTFFTTHTPK